MHDALNDNPQNLGYFTQDIFCLIINKCEEGTLWNQCYQTGQ